MNESSSRQGVVAISRVIAASAAQIFHILADPARHPDFDGSRLLRAAVDAEPITAAGQTFGMKLFLDSIGDYEVDNHVVEFVRDRTIAWEPAPRGAEASGAGVEPGVRPGQRWTYVLRPVDADRTEVTEIYDCSRATREVRERVGDGEAWVRSMAKSLERLEKLAVSAAASSAATQTCTDQSVECES